MSCKVCALNNMPPILLTQKGLFKYFFKKKKHLHHFFNPKDFVSGGSL